jgi:hypothetical protein
VLASLPFALFAPSGAARRLPGWLRRRAGRRQTFLRTARFCGTLRWVPDRPGKHPRGHLGVEQPRRDLAAVATCGSHRQRATPAQWLAVPGVGPGRSGWAGEGVTGRSSSGAKPASDAVGDMALHMVRVTVPVTV